MKANERSAHGVRGYLIREVGGELVFRVYTSEDRKNFKDYKICHCDLQVEITDNYSSFYDGETKCGLDGYLDYPSRLTEKDANVLRKADEAKDQAQQPADCPSAAAHAPEAGCPEAGCPEAGK